ncbi:hypothetical protein, partial [Nocardia sp. CC201C]|uniref:hypothetical protein n=1 Tax=Nocardia sp. CC201C TaxID=3044575 RepID=UPI0024A9ABCC
MSNSAMPTGLRRAATDHVTVGAVGPTACSIDASRVRAAARSGLPAAESPGCGRCRVPAVVAAAPTATADAGLATPAGWA